MRNYFKEEVFLDEFYNWASAASNILNGEWKPNWNCNDSQRQQNDYFMKSGQMTWLVFTSASVQNDPGQEVHAQIILESSKRIVNIKVATQDNKSIAEIQIDKAK